MLRNNLVGLLVGVLLVTVVGYLPAAELTPADVADAKGDGPDGKGNTADDTFQFWFELIHAPKFRRLDRHSSEIPDGIPGKVTGPVGGSTPNPADTQGWVFHSDWDGRFEGIWGDAKVPQVLAHPYNEKNSGGAVAVTYTVPADGKYTVSGQVTDLQVAGGHPSLDGITYRVGICEGDPREIGADLKTLSSGKVGDQAGPATASFEVEHVELLQGQLVRLVIAPNKSWGADMTRIDSFKIIPNR